MMRLSIIGSLLLLFMLTGCYSEVSNDYVGEIAMTYPNTKLKSLNNYQKGIMIYLPSTKRFSHVAQSRGFSDLSFSENKKKIMGVSTNNTIFEYDIETNNMTLVYKGSNEDASYDYLKYVPKSDLISFCSYPNLCIYNQRTKEIKKILPHIWGEYSWTKDGKKLLYSISGRGTIYSLDIENNKSTLYSKEGFSPQLSRSNNYIAFMTKNGEIIVKEIKTSRKWSYKGLELIYYKFSPDDKYLAIIEVVPSKTFMCGINLTVWDFRNNKKNTLIEDIYQGCQSNFDWK